MFYLLNSFAIIMLFIYKICIIILSVVCFLVSYSYDHSCFFLSKPSTLCLYSINAFWYAWFASLHVASFYLNSVHSFFNFGNSISFRFISLFSMVRCSIFTLILSSISFFCLFQVYIHYLYILYPCRPFFICFNNPYFSFPI